MPTSKQYTIEENRAGGGDVQENFRQMPETEVKVEEEKEEEEEEAEKTDIQVEIDSRIIYRVHEVPPVFMWPVYGMQQTVMCVAGTLTVPFLISTYICASQLPHVRAQLLSVAFFMCGVATLLQTTIGIRLPVIQGASYAFLPPILTLMQLDEWKCPDADQELGPDEEEPWIIRIREIQGNLMLASVTQVVLGCTGLVGLLLHFIGPITIAPTVALIGLGFTGAITDYAQIHWGVATFTASLVLLFSLWLGNTRIPVPSYSADRGCHTTRFPVFIVISVLLAVCLGWLFCYILTVADALPSNSTEPAYGARTDINLHVIDEAPWFRFPYPLVFGMPTVSVAGFFGMFLATMSSVLESIGDYYACARVSGAPPPPPSAVNRGMAIEGFSSIISGLVATGHGTTTYSGNIAAIAVTRVASRRVFQMAGLILVLMGLVTKVGAVMTLIPDPVIGGLNAVLLGTLVSVGVSTLHFVNMESTRNMTVIGLTFALGLAIPQWIHAEQGRINTGSKVADQILTILLGTPMFMGGLLGVILDNLAPGTREERGIDQWKRMTASNSNSAQTQENEQRQTYDLPFVSGFLRRVPCCSFVPFLPSFQGLWTKKTKMEKQPTAVNSDKRVVAVDNEVFESDSCP